MAQPLLSARQYLERAIQASMEVQGGEQRDSSRSEAVGVEHVSRIRKEHFARQTNAIAPSFKVSDVPEELVMPSTVGSKIRGRGLTARARCEDVQHVGR